METRYYPNNSARVEGEDDSPIISGMGAVFYDGTPRTEFELWPGVVERVMPTFFDAALSENQDVRGLTNHDANMLLGRTGAGTMRLSKSSAGLAYSIDGSDTQASHDTQTNIKRGDMTGSSFSFTVRTETWTKEDRDGVEIEVRELNEVDTLFDVGPVTFPAYKATTADARTEARASYDAWKGADKKPDTRNALAKRTRARMVELQERG